MTARVEFLDDEAAAARGATVDVADISLVADLSGALFWEEQSLLVVSDLHLEKGSSFAARGVLLPPFDTVATLGRLAAVIARHDPRMVIALGDSFHDREAHERRPNEPRGGILARVACQDEECHEHPRDGRRPEDPEVGQSIACLHVRESSPNFQ